ncbi:MAG: DNA (cytosine-5-)-methyltransferase [Phycisphaerae bacterium]|nr:DNA (cytosine-5-)-methyltransferase [Phycisphaerae bacterium]
MRRRHTGSEGAAYSKDFAEFFAGIGLVHLGLQPSGWRCVYANDIEPKKHAMYEAQFGRAAHYHLEDIWNTDAVAGRLAKAPFLATASFPCVDLSLAGHWRGIDGEHSSTYFGFLKVLERMRRERPKVVMLENVCGFLTSRKGADFQRALGGLAELGYWVDAIVLDAKWFVPQSRPRLFVFGFHDTLDSPLVIRRREGLALDDPWAMAVDRTAVVRPNGLLSLSDRTYLPTGWATVAFPPPQRMEYRLLEVIDLDDSQEWWSDEETSRHYEMMETPSKRRVDELIGSGDRAIGAAFRRTRRGQTRCEVRFDLAGCLRTPKGGSAKQIVVAVVGGKLRMRWMSAREYARLQGAGEFNITVPPLQAMYGFGDAVCVPAVRWIDRHILTPVFESHSAALPAHAAPASA